MTRSALIAAVLAVTLVACNKPAPAPVVDAPAAAAPAASAVAAPAAVAPTAAPAAK